MPHVESHPANTDDAILRRSFRGRSHDRKLYLAIRRSVELPLDQILSNEIPGTKLAAKVHSIRRRVRFVTLQLLGNPVFGKLVNQFESCI
jgi:hypothetical protein